MVNHDGVADGVDAAPTGTTGELREFAGRQAHMTGTVELLEFLYHHAAGRHIDAQGQCFRGEHHFDQTFFEQSFDYLAEQGNHAGMMRSEAFFQRKAELEELQGFQVFLSELPLHHLIHDAANLGHFLIGGELQSSVDTLFHGLVTTVAREDEVDAGQHSQKVKLVHHGPAARGVAFRFRGMALGAFAAAASAEALALIGAFLAAPACGLAVQLVEPVDEFGVELGGLLAVAVAAIEIQHLRLGVFVRLHDDVLFQRHGAVFADHQFGVASHRGNPVGEILHVGHGSGQADDLDRLGQVDDDFLPHGPAEPVGQIVHFVENHVAQCVQRGGTLVEHVAQHFGGHDHDVRLGVDRGVAGEQAYLVRAVHVDQIMVFLIAQRFDRCGIEGFDVAFLGEINGKIRHYGFAGTGWGRDQYVAAGFERVIGFGLEVVQFEGQGFGESRCCGRPMALDFLE